MTHEEDEPAPAMALGELSGSAEHTPTDAPSGSSTHEPTEIEPTEVTRERPRVVALGNRFASDDAAALRVADRLLAEGLDVVLAGRPGASLIELLDRPCVLLDVVRHGVACGALVELPLDRLAEASIAARSVSSHDLGPSSALRLGVALGRPTPRGVFLGIGGRIFGPGETLSPEVERALDGLTDSARAALARLEAAAIDLFSARPKGASPRSRERRREATEP